MEIAFLVLACVLAGAALFGVWRLHRRLDDLAERMQEAAPLSFLPERVQAVARILENADLTGLHERLEQVAAGLSRVEDLVVAPAEGGSSAGTRAQQVRARVLRHLRDEGYSSIRILNSEEELERDPVEVRLQALRRGTLIAGVVSVAGEEVLELRLNPVYTAFP